MLPSFRRLPQQLAQLASIHLALETAAREAPPVLIEVGLAIAHLTSEQFHHSAR